MIIVGDVYSQDPNYTGTKAALYACIAQAQSMHIAYSIAYVTHKMHKYELPMCSYYEFFWENEEEQWRYGCYM